MQELLTITSQFGAAGLIGVLWLMERRQAATRDRQLDQAHERIMDRSGDVGVLIGVIRDNTKAISRLEQSQDRLLRVLEHTAPSSQAVARSQRQAEEQVT